MSKNYLDKETSPYLLQHKDNPVHWLPWSEGAFEKAKNENKPTGTIMIVRPLTVNENDLTFYQAQLNSYHILGDTRQSINYGIGKRFLAEDGSSFLGVNSFFK